MESENKKPDNRGGARPGAGAKPRLKGGGPVKPYLDTETIIQMSELGNGNLSAGIRKAGKVVKHLPRKTLAALASINDLDDPGAVDKILDSALGK